MDPETTDILGGRLPTPQAGSSGLWIKFNSTSVFNFVLATLFAAWLWSQRVLPWYRQRQELIQRKAKRRKHGIPDSDNRPFDVAFAAAQRARQGREAEEKRQALLRRNPPIQASASTGYQPHLQPTTQENRPRSGYVEHRDTQTYAGQTGTSAPLSIQFQSTQPRYAHNTDSHNASSSVSAGIFVNDDKDTGVAHTQEVPGIGDGSEEGEDPLSENGTEVEMDVDEQSPVRSKRGYKRVASLELDEATEGNRLSSREKRARKLSRGNSSSELQDHEMEDELMELESIPRGKKRDRGEAGSTFGGDDSPMDDDDKPRRRRRRRTTSHRKLDSLSRGQKRSRQSNDSMDTDGEESERSSRRSIRQRRGKGTSDEGDLSLDDGMISHDPLCKGRHIGEEWESNGIFYKVGPNGQRLRQALVKKSRSRFHMPKDSEHPDRGLSINVFVETWLSDEEYQLAKENHDLAWQDSPPITEPNSPSDVSESPSKSGKNLLWSSTSRPKDSPGPRRRAFRQSIATSVGLRVNPFNQSQTPATRRVTSFSGPMSLVPDSPKLRPSKSYSKWEKQDLEAAAMSKLREKSLKQQTPPVETKPTPQPTTAAPAVTTPSVPAVPSVSTAGSSSTAPPALLFPLPTKPVESTKLANDAKPAIGDPAKPSIFSTPAATNQPSFEPSKPSTVPFPTSSAPTPAFQLLKAPPQTLFAKPTEQPAATSTPFTSGVPNFAKPVAPPAPTTAAPASLATAPPLSSGPSKPSFSWTPPTSSSSEKPNQEQKADATQPMSSGPLFSRIGGPSLNGGAASQKAFTPSPLSNTNIFAKPSTPAPNAGTATPTAPPLAAPPKFSFNSFNVAGPTGAATGSTSDAAKPSTSPFNFGNPSDATPTFNAALPGQATPNSTSGNPTGTFSSGSNGLTQKESHAPSPFNFNGGDAAKAPSQPASKGSNPIFSFTAPPTQPLNPAPKFSFNFGPAPSAGSATSTSAPSPFSLGTTNGDAAKPSTSPFGSAPTSSTFGFGNAPTSTNLFNFGSSNSTNTGQK